MNKRGKNKHRRGFKAHFTAFLIVLIIMLIVTILLVNQSGLANVTLLTLITQTIHNIIPHSSKSITPPITTTIPPSNVTNTSGVKTKLTTFNESGLPAGTFWSIKFNSITVYSNVNYLEFPSTENIITFFVNNVTVNGCVFIPHPSSSAVTSGTINLINFSAVCTTTINETGLPLNSSWFATYNGISKNSTSNLIHFKTGYGVYNFSLPLVGASGKLFLPYPSSGYLKAGSVLQIVFISPSSNSSKGVTFIEKGLPVGTNWTVSYNNLTLNSSSASILFNTSSGISYPFFKIVSIQQSGCLFTPNPSKGPASPGEIINVNFSANCNTSFTESGLPSKTLWKVSYGNYSLSSSSSSINLSSGYMVSAFSIRDIISGNCTYYPSANVTGTIVSGSEIGVVFVPKCISTFFETGIPKGVSWSVDYDNSTLSSYSNNIGFNASNGTFDFNIKTSVKGGCIYTPYPRNGSIVSGSAENISFTQECHTVFNSSGLPDGVSWAVTYDGGTRDGGYNSSIEFPYYANTSFGYSVSTIQLGNCTFYPSPNTGNIEGGALLKIHFSGSCTTQFSETGLPSGDTWAVTYDNKTNSSSSNLIFSSINGTYSFNASNVPASNGCYYVPNPSSGSLVAGSNESILYVNKCTTAFIDPGLPSGANWTVEFAGVTKHSITQNVSFLLTPGKYYYQVPQTSFNGCNYLPNETSGSASVGESVQLSFNLSTCDTVFTEKGLPSGSSWQVTYDNASIDSQANYLNFNNIPGNYSFSIGSIVLGTCTFTPNESSGTIAAGSDTVIGFLSSCYTDFYESGLPVNSLWRVNYAGYTNSSIGTSIAVHSNYLTSPYTVYNVSVGSQCYYMPQPYSGNDSAGTSVSISYVKECVSSFDEKGLYKGVQWSIEYNDIFSSSSSNSTSVIASPGNHSYSIPDAYGDGCTFVPSVNSGYMVSGDTLNVSFIPVSCTTVLSESGLPNGQKWNATFSTFNTSMSSKLYINTNPGNFTLDVPSLNLSNCIFSANYPSVVRAGSHVSLHFGATCYSNISETGLPAGTNWTLRLHSQYNLDGNLVFSGHSYSTTKSYIEWVSVNTSRSFTIYNVPINSKCYYIPSPSSGSITAGQNLKIIFTNNCVTVFSESGLPSGAKWISEYDGINFTSGSSSASFITSAGPHDFRIYYGKSNGCYYSPNMTSGIINSGSKLTIGFKVVYCLTEFVNIGLPSRTIWSVDYNSSNISSNSSRIIFNTSASNKSLSYNVSPKNISSSNCYIYASGATGSVIPGSNVTINYINLCKTTFIESGLPSGSEWYVNFDKTVNHSNVSSLVVYGLPGTHSFKISVVSVGSGCFYQPSPAAGNVSSGNSESISYSLECNTTFNSTGLPTGAVWNVNYSGSVLSSKSQSIVFTTKPGNYSFSLSSVKFDSCLYTPSPSSGSLLAGGNESVLFTENTCNTTFIESGLPTGTSWKLKYDGIPVSSSENNTSITTPSGIFSLELYPVKILGCTYSPNIYSGSVAAGSRFRVSFSVSCYTYFNETGLPNGTSWFVDYNGTSVSSNISVIQIPSKYGDYAYSIAYVGNSSCYYSSSPSSGYILSGSTLGVKYSGGCTTSFYENGLPLNTNWTMYYNGTEEYSKTSSMQFLTSPGIHNYSIPSLNVSNCLYVPESTSGNLSAGSNMDIIFNQTSCYTSFRTKGLPVGVSWTINFDDNDINYTQASGSLTVQTNPGTFNLTVYTIHNDNCTFLPVPSSARIAAGSSIYINYTSNCVTTLIESGLANGITWSAKYDGITNYSSSNSIEIDSIYGNFSFNVSAIQTSANCYLIPNPSNGTVLSGSSVMTNFSSHCLSQFSESGLPSGAVWSVRYDNKTNSSSSSAVLFDVPYGNYSYNVSSVKYDNCYYTPNSSSGYAVAGHYTSLDFTETVCTAYFYESGLPSGTKWNVTYDNLESSSVSNLTAINTSTGTYPFYVPAQTNSGCIYTAVPSSGDVGAGSNTSITFSRAYCISEFEETGLPEGFLWNVTFDSNTTVSNTSDILFNTTYGTFYYQTSTIISGQCQFIPSPASGSVTTGDHTLIAFTSVCKSYFSENGLPSGYKWKLAYDNKTLLSSNSTIEFSTSYGNFDFSVTPVVEYNCGFTPNMSGGHILAGSNLSFTFTNSSCTKPFIMPISLYNNNNVSLPSDYQQELVFNSSEYSRYENTNLSNIMFTYSNGTVIPSWLESGNSNSSNRTVYWLKVGSIPKESGIIIDMIFNRTLKDYAVDFNNVSTGEALQFSPSYVDYNDIQNVMSKGLVYQIYYDSASTGTGVNSAQEIALYGASMSNGTVISTGGQSFIASTPVFITSENVSSQDVDGTTRNYVIDNMQGGYSGGSAFPNPPVSNYNDAFMIKQLGFVQLLNATQFSMEIDDGGTLGVNGSTYNATSWIGGTDNPSNLINEWTSESAKVYSSPIVGAGDYGIELDYINQGGPGYLGLWSNLNAEYYYPTVLVNGLSAEALINQSLVSTTVIETGLPSGYKWSADYDNINKSSNSSNITFSTSSGNHTMNLVALSNVSSVLNCVSTYTPNVTSITLKAGSQVIVHFSASDLCTTSFSEEGLAPNSSWSVLFDGKNASSFIHSVIVPTGILRYKVLKIYNSQNVSTTSPLQQEVNVSNDIYAGLAAPNFQNVEFFYFNGTVIPDWLVSYDYSQSSLYWIDLGSIPANSSITIYLGFASNFTDTLNAINKSASSNLGPYPQPPTGSQSSSALSENYTSCGNFYDLEGYPGSAASNNAICSWSGGKVNIYMAGGNGGYSGLSITGVSNGVNYYNHFFNMPYCLSSYGSIYLPPGQYKLSTSRGNGGGGCGPGGFVLTAPTISLSYPNGVMPSVTFVPRSNSFIASNGSMIISNVTYGNYSAIASTNLSCSSQSKSVQAGSKFLFNGWKCNDTFITSNIPNGYNFSVTLNNITRTGTTGLSLIVPVVSDTTVYNYNVSSPSIKYMASGEAYSGTTTYLSTWLITKQFIESGLPTGTSWYVNYNGTVKHSTSNSIDFIVKSSNLSFVIPNVGVGAYIYVPNITSGLTGINENTSVSFRRENALIPADLISFIPINITNSKSIATPAPFQELINLSYSNYSSYANLSSGYDFHNVEFFNETNGKIIDSWLENYTSKYALFWIKLPEGIPANTTIGGIAVGFAQKSINLLNNLTTGEAPQLSSTYGKYDDGANVFNYYWNFAGTTLPNGWSTTEAASLTVDNGVSFKGVSTGGNAAQISYEIAVPRPFVFDAMGYSPAPASDNPTISLAYVNTYSSAFTSGYAAFWQINTSAENLYSWSGGSSTIVASNTDTAPLTTNNIYSLSLGPTSGNISSFINYGTAPATLSWMDTLNYNNYYIALSSWWNNKFINITWARVRAYPPDGVMPSVTFGSIHKTPVVLYLNGVANHNDSITYGTQSNFTVIPSNASEYVRLWKKFNGSITPLTNFSKSKSTYLANLSPRVETIIAGTNSSGIRNVSYSQTINKSIPTLTLSTLPSENYVYNGTNITLKANVSTIGSQVNATLYINGKLNQTITSQKIINLGSAFGKYSITLNTSGNQNYTNNSVSIVRQIYPSSSLVEYYIPLKISNTQTIATPAPFQQLINLSYPSYENYINLSNGYKFQNVMFFNVTSGHPIESWLENYTSKYALFWIKLPNGIAANTTINDIAVGFASNSTNLLNNGTVGEAPQLSSVYGEYDDGANVFDFYDNFAGTTINSEYTQVIPSGTTITQSNGITISTDSSATYGGLILTKGFSNSPIQIFGGDVKAVSGVAAGFAIQNGNSASSGGYDFNYWGGSVAYGSMSGGMTGNKNPDLQISTGIMEGAWISSSSQVWYKNYVSTAGSQTAESLPSNNILYPSIGIYYSSSSTSITYQWVRTRAYPPNGIMPYVTFASSINTPVTLYLNGAVNHNDSITYGTQSNFTVISSNASKYVRLWKKVNGSITPLTNFSKSKSTYLANLSTGVETIIAGTNSSGIRNVSYSQTINKSVPVLTLSTLPSENYVYNGTNITLKANVSTIGSQVNATLYINGKLNQTITSQKTINLGSAPGNYSIILNTSGNHNYTSNSVSSVILIYYGSTAEYYIPLNISNTQTIATPAPFQQLINISYSNYSSYANLSNGYDFQNVEFFNDTNGKIIDSWLENYTSKYALFWIKLPNGIPANTTISDIAVGFGQKNISLLNNVTTGEAPQLSSTYAEYDDGANVFINYWNFAGTSLPSGWTGSGYTQDNGISISSTGAINYTAVAYSANVTLDIYGDIVYSSSPGQYAWGVYGFGGPTGGNVFGTANSNHVLGGTPGEYYAYGYYEDSTDSSSFYYTSKISNIYEVQSIALTGTTDSYYLGYSKLANSYTQENSKKNYIRFYTGGSNAEDTINMYWLRIRAYPPNGVMPKVLFSSTIAT